MSWNCPDNSSIKLSGQGPPGKSTFSVEPIAQAEMDSEEQAEILDSLPLVLDIPKDLPQYNPGCWKNGRIITCIGMSPTFCLKKIWGIAM